MGLEGSNYESVDKSKSNDDTVNKEYKMDFQKENFRKVEENESKKVDAEEIDDLLTMLENTDSKTFGITLIDEVREKNKLEEGEGDTTPTEESDGNVDENGEATGNGNMTVDEGTGWDPNATDETVVNVEEAQELNKSWQKNIKNVVPNNFHIGNDSGKTGKNMNNK